MGSKKNTPWRKQGEGAAHLKLLSWLSPSYPVGAFSYSHGLEYAVEAGQVTSAAECQDWVADILCHGSGRNDAIFLKSAYQAAAGRDAGLLVETAELAAAYGPALELRQESLNQGEAFLKATRAAWPVAALDWLAECWAHPCAYPVAVGVASQGHRIAFDAALQAYLHGLAANLVSAALRLVPLGQSDGLAVTAALEPEILAMAKATIEFGLDDLGSSALAVEIAAMKHETQYTRLFRS
jgi:urease accessory protein